MRFLSPLFIFTALWAQESAEFRNWLNQGEQPFRTTQYAHLDMGAGRSVASEGDGDEKGWRRSRLLAASRNRDCGQVSSLVGLPQTASL